MTDGIPLWQYMGWSHPHPGNHGRCVSTEERRFVALLNQMIRERRAR